MSAGSAWAGPQAAGREHTKAGPGRVAGAKPSQPHLAGGRKAAVAAPAAAPANNGQETPAGLCAGERETHVLPVGANSDGPQRHSADGARPHSASQAR